MNRVRGGERRDRSALAAVCAALLTAGCTSTTNGPAPSLPETPIPVDAGADVSRMDTGQYATVPNHPYPRAGDDRLKQGLLESQRLAEVTVGPWQINPKLVLRGTELDAGITARFYNADLMRNNGAFDEPLPDIAGRNGLMAGFASLRFAPTADPKSPVKFWSLLTAVMRFPDPAAAATAAAQMAAAYPPPSLASGPRQAVQIGADPNALAATWPLSDGREMVTSFATKGELVLYQASTLVPGNLLNGTLLNAKSVVDSALSKQKNLLANFVPTPADKLPELPMDPSGYLMARLIDNPSGSVPGSIGVWTPQSWLHIEDNPIEAAPWLRDAGVDWVGQRLSTVYRTRDGAAAETLLHEVVNEVRFTAPAKPAGEVPGLPRARCFERPTGIPADAAATMKRVFWHYKCAAAAGRYVFTVYADTLKDAAQRLSAQYRILAGK